MSVEEVGSLSAEVEGGIPVDEQQLGKKDIFPIIASSAAEYYKTIVSVATLFLGGTLLFLEKIVPAGSTIIGKPILGTGWALLISSILFIVIVQLSNIESGKGVMLGKTPKAAIIDQITDILSWAAIFCLSSGIGCVMYFGYVNLNRPGNGGADKAMENKIIVPDSIRTIPFSTTQPKVTPPATTAKEPILLHHLKEKSKVVMSDINRDDFIGSLPFSITQPVIKERPTKPEPAEPATPPVPQEPVKISGPTEGE